MRITIEPETDREMAEMPDGPVSFSAYQFVLVGRQHPEGDSGRCFGHTHYAEDDPAANLYDLIGDVHKVLADVQGVIVAQNIRRTSLPGGANHATDPKPTAQTERALNPAAHATPDVIGQVVEAFADRSC